MALLNILVSAVFSVTEVAFYFVSVNSLFFVFFDYYCFQWEFAYHFVLFLQELLEILVLGRRKSCFLKGKKER